MKSVMEDANSAEVLVLLVALAWIRQKQWSDVTVITDSRTVVTNLDDKQKIRDKYFNQSNACREFISENRVKNF